MKKKLWLILSSFLVLSSSIVAQNQIDESSAVDKQSVSKLKQIKAQMKASAPFTDLSYYFEENHYRQIHELNVLLGKTSSSNGGFDSTNIFTYTTKQKVSGTTTYWQRPYQKIPLRDSAQLNKMYFLAQGLKTNGSTVKFKVFKKDFTTLLGTATVTVGNNLDYYLATFSTPIKHNDSIIIAFEMNSVADSFKLAKTASFYNGFDFGTAQSPKIYNTNLPFNFTGGIQANALNYSSKIGDITSSNAKAGTTFDFFILPEFTLKVKQTFTASDLDLNICVNDSISFTNFTTGLVTNPILNTFEYDRYANNAAPYYTKYIYFNGATPVTSSTQSGGKKYTQAGTYVVKAILSALPWSTNLSTQRDTATFTVNV